mmetsp:Transcript_16180/g.52778  ORF Transcript_16180/g.52778 Transcript_16180/m.52778 type:complete len:223 (+) Transcript_16180:4628-5296(+)
MPQTAEAVADDGRAHVRADQERVLAPAALVDLGDDLAVLDDGALAQELLQRVHRRVVEEQRRRQLRVAQGLGEAVHELSHDEAVQPVVHEGLVRGHDAAHDLVDDLGHGELLVLRARPRRLRAVRARAPPVALAAADRVQLGEARRARPEGGDAGLRRRRAVQTVVGVVHGRREPRVGDGAREPKGREPRAQDVVLRRERRFDRRREGVLLEEGAEVAVEAF